MLQYLLMLLMKLTVFQYAILKQYLYTYMYHDYQI